MKIRTTTIAAAVLTLGLAAWTLPFAHAQVWDVVHVNMPYTVTIQDKELPPGEYIIQQLKSPAGSSNVLLIYSNKGMKFETSAMTIKALDINTPQDTSIVLHHIGDGYYYDKIWIAGKDYGYEFPLPSSVRARQKELMAQANVTVPAQYSTTPAKTDGDTTATTSTEPVTTPDPITTATTQVTSVEPLPVVTPTQPDVPVTPVTEQVQQPVTTPDTSANREKRDTSDTTPEMPATSAGWLGMLLGGGTLTGAGMLLRRKR